MTQPPPIIPGPTAPFTLASVLPASPPPRAPRSVVLLVAALVVVALAGAGVAVWALTGRPGAAAPAPTTSAPTLRQNAPTTVAYPTPTAGDFAVTVNVVKQSCFGSAGCNVTYKVDVVYNGAVTEPGKVWYVTYQVTGGDDPQINTFEFQSTSATKYSVSVPREQLVQTPRSDSVLTAAVTRVAEH